jgi:uncharacterized protein HemY
MSKFVYFAVVAVVIFFAVSLILRQAGHLEFSSAYAAQKKEVQVKGHMKKDGTYVKPHKRIIKKKKTTK